MSKTHIDNVIDSFLESVLSPNAGQYQREAMGYAFYAGVCWLHGKTEHAIDNLKDSEDDAFFREVVVQLAKRVGVDLEAIEQRLRDEDSAAPPGPFKEGVSKVSAITGEEIPATPEEKAKATEAFREALLDPSGKKIVFSDKVREQLKERGMTEDQILAMLAGQIGLKQ